MQYEDQHTVATPEGVELVLPLAGLGSRFAAFLVDAILQGLVIAALLFLAAELLGGVAATIVSAFGPVLGVLAYFVLFEVLAGGRTPGKRALGLRVVRSGGRPVGLGSSLVRNVLRLIDALPVMYVVAIVSILVTRNNQRLGDLAAGTLVVREPGKSRRPAPSRAAPLPGPDTASWDVAGLGERELVAVRAFLDRREQLDAGARRALAEQLADALRPRVAGAPAGLDDERFLERLVAVKSSRM